MGALESRRGFSFQDQYACHLFLKHLNDQTIRGLRTEVEAVNRKKTIDVKINLATGEEEYHEVKCGVSIRRNSQKLSQTIRKLYDYWLDSGCPPSHRYIIGFSGDEYALPFHERIGLIQQVKNNPHSTIYHTRNALLRIRKDFPFLKGAKDSDLLNFLQRISPNEVLLKSGEYDEFNEILCREIEKLVKARGLNSRLHILPPSHLSYALCVKINHLSGDTSDNTGALIDLCADYFARLRWLTDRRLPAKEEAQIAQYKEDELKSAANLLDLALPKRETELMASQQLEGRVLR